MAKFQSPAVGAQPRVSAPVKSYGNDDKPITAKGTYAVPTAEELSQLDQDGFYEFDDDLDEKDQIESDPSNMQHVMDVM